MSRVSNKLSKRSRQYFLVKILIKRILRRYSSKPLLPVKLSGVDEFLKIIKETEDKIKRECGIPASRLGSPSAVAGPPVTVTLRKMNYILTKKEAIQAMAMGLRVTHPYFTDDEFIYMKAGDIYDEKDYLMGDMFWEDRNTPAWDTNWRALTDQP